MALTESADGRHLVAEYDVEGEVTTTGEQYVLRYVWCRALDLYALVEFLTRPVDHPFFAKAAAAIRRQLTS